ncbi:FAD-binding oxidoreductase [Bacillus canaveralius]|uniref:FAD-binding oxidoreductase n=1 Tax=Bacillus canaveralius TaxID=1403243 RepID=A0A2N5GKR8_9BACI|nr:MULTISPECIES: FAD-binding oxidoreductase [Bacillus]PLR82102.1 FAD-binding oxidoreductase [Bacillus canaveralius]PLR83930.1 FAD-binding oxidoreductase [Bacillus sp. V33-4]PLR97992.1 FAD-binding oxidoreductase [Bacillus canaveralius]RSK54427.1 FAD-binding oxidoreductase [Bacillus canaveralius]
MVTAELLTELRTILPEERIIVAASPCNYLGNNGQLHIFPISEEEISAVLKYANDHRTTVAIEGGGTKRGFGGLTKACDILLSLANYKGVVEHTVGDMTLTVKAGTTFTELQDFLQPYNQKIALDPASPELATIGGIIAANESGPKRLGYGSARDAVIGLRIVYPDGSIIRTGGKVVKNVAGYDMNKLFIGAMGTLGVVSEVTVKLRPIAKFESLILISFPNGSDEEIRQFVIRLLDSTMEPVTLELLNPSLSARLNGRQQYTLAIGLEDVESSVYYQENFIKSIQPARTDLDVLQQSAARAFWDQFSAIAPNGTRDLAGEDIEAVLKIGVVNLDVLNVIKESELLQDSFNLKIEAHGGFGHGLCHVNLRGTNEEVVAAIGHLRDHVSKLRGYVVVKHLPFALRQQVNVWGDKPPYFFLLEGIKEKIDPNRVLNPNRFLGGI